MLKKIKCALATIGLKPNVISSVGSIKIVQEDPQAAQSMSRVKKKFEQQDSEMQSRALIAHSYDCEDNFECKKEVCWKWEPDKIVGDYYFVDKNTRQIWKG